MSRVGTLNSSISKAKDPESSNKAAKSIHRYGNEYEAVIVQTKMSLIESAVRHVIFDFTTSVFSKSGAIIEPSDIFAAGDYVIFRENTTTCPVIVVAINLCEDLWCIFCGNECGPTKCDELLAMKCARLEFQNLNILKDVLSDGIQNDELLVPSSWRASLLLRQADPEFIIDEITWRFAK